VLGEISPGQIRNIRVCILSDGKMHSLDNRRLYAFKEAIKRGSGFRTVTAIRSFDFEELQSKMSKSSSFNDWSEIRVRGKLSRTQNRPNLNVNSSYTRVQNRPNIFVNSVPTRPSIYVDSLHTRTQDIPSIYVNSLYKRIQERPNIYVSSLHTETQDRPNIRVNSLPKRTQSTFMSWGDDDYTYSMPETPKPPKKEGWCVIS
jgi:hypothetical protein